MTLTVDVAPDAMGFVPWIYENATVTARDDREDGAVSLTMDITKQARTELRRMSEHASGVSFQR